MYLKNEVDTAITCVWHFYQTIYTSTVKSKCKLFLITFCFSSSGRASIRTFAHGNSLGHQGGLVVSLPQPGFPLPKNNKRIHIHGYQRVLTFNLSPIWHEKYWFVMFQVNIKHNKAEKNWSKKNYSTSTIYSQNRGYLWNVNASSDICISMVVMETQYIYLNVIPKIIEMVLTQDKFFIVE